MTKKSTSGVAAGTATPATTPSVASETVINNVDNAAGAAVATSDAPVERDHKQAIAYLVANGATLHKARKVRGVTVSPGDTRTLVTIRVDKPVPGYVQDENDNYVAGDTDKVFVTLWDVLHLFRENDDLAMIGNAIARNPRSLEVLLAGATLNVVQEQITAGDVTLNPYTGEERQASEHDTVYSHIDALKLSDRGMKCVDKLIDHLLFGQM